MGKRGYEIVSELLFVWYCIGIGQLTMHLSRNCLYGPLFYLLRLGNWIWPNWRERERLMGFWWWPDLESWQSWLEPLLHDRGIFRLRCLNITLQLPYKWRFNPLFLLGKEKEGKWIRILCSIQTFFFLYYFLHQGLIFNRKITKRWRLL